MIKNIQTCKKIVHQWRDTHSTQRIWKWTDQYQISASWKSNRSGTTDEWKIWTVKMLMNMPQTKDKLQYNQDTETLGLWLHNDPPRNRRNISHIPHPIISKESTIDIWGRRDRGILTWDEKLHVKEAWKPENPKMPTKEEDRKYLEYLIILNQKWCGKIKGQGCADGRKNRANKKKEENS